MPAAIRQSFWRRHRPQPDQQDPACDQCRGLAAEWPTPPAFRDKLRLLLWRWHLQLEYIVIPKSVTPARMAANLDVFDFELTFAEMRRISALNTDTRTGPDPDVF